jgi:hypothetical protein
MTATVAGIHLGLDTHANRPAANTVPDGSEYSCSTHSLIYKSNYAGNSWATWFAGSAGLTDPMTTRGDIIVRNASNVTARLAVGAANRAVISDGTDISWGQILPATLDVSADNTTADATTGHHGLLPKLGGGSTNFLRADGTWNAPAGGGSTVGDDVILSGGDITTTSTTFVDLTGASITLTTGAHRCLIGFAAEVHNNTVDKLTYLDVDVDGTRISGHSGGLTRVQQNNPNGANYSKNGSFTAMTTAQLTAASHTFKLQWRVDGGTGKVSAGTAGSSQAQFWVTELLS